MAKFQELLTSKYIKDKRLSVWQVESMVQRFLTHRCSKEFLSQYLQENIYLLDKVAEPGLYLNGASEVSLAVLLFDLGLLPEKKRERFINTVTDYAIQGEDLYALDSADIKHMFIDREFEDLLEKVHSQLIPRLDAVRQDIEENYQTNESAEEHMQPFLDTLDILKKHFCNHIQTNDIIEKQMDQVNEWISNNTNEEPEIEPQLLGNIENRSHPDNSRSIFDDIDV